MTQFKIQENGFLSHDRGSVEPTKSLTKRRKDSL